MASPTGNGASSVLVLQLIRISQLSATVASFYDHVTSFDQEVELIWQHPGRTGKILYFLTRYCGNCIVLAVFIMVVVDMDSDRVSKVRLYLQIWATAVPAWVVQAIMQFRLFAMYDRSRRLLCFMTTCYVIQVVAIMSFTLYQDTEVSVIRVEGWTVCLLTKVPRLLIGTWLSIMAFEGLLFSLALYKTVLHLREMRTNWTRENITTILLRDNLLYFLIMFTTYAMTVVTSSLIPSILSNIVASFTITLTCIMGSRLILNIRRAAFRHGEWMNTEEIGHQLQALGGDHGSSSRRDTVPSNPEQSVSTYAGLGLSATTR
ncbi:hypothetical protein JAAARDRAFT_548650 [Jaapia argillacea MUCL 33604]|uniref:DUF6533 domain-containing protein n=1 Tax=Jaapia argillacea MUCL 33604 TaxID=933084 RepID=A0A067PAH4_9AGAM|nr:hypothetical protein JAAARDRAFT_548650 [Jaapia argillacea MUCL 33604]